MPLKMVMNMLRNGEQFLLHDCTHRATHVKYPVIKVMNEERTISDYDERNIYPWLSMMQIISLKNM
jgi:hypothetical protein